MFRRLALILIAIAATALPALAERRVALILAVDKYRTIRPLKNAVADARSVEETLKALGFEVTTETDRDLRRTRRALDDFRDDAADADVALVYYAGHGVEIDGQNRLLPADADASSLEALEKSTLPLEEVRDAVAAVAKVGLIVLDACRNDPFGTDGPVGSRSAVALIKKPLVEARPGLGRVGRAENILFAFSAAPGETASDGNDGHSPFAEALEKYLPADGLEIRSVLTLVQQDVYDLTRGKQLPYVESGLPKVFFATAASSGIPERERLLLAMADLTPTLRADVERVAADRKIPLAPLYGALVSADLASLDMAARAKKLAEAADAFVKARDQMQALAGADPAVAKLRDEARQQLDLGVFKGALATLAEAAAIDETSRSALKSNFVDRTLSEAATHRIAAQAAAAGLDYATAITEYERAIGLFAEVGGETLPAKSRQLQILTLADLGDLAVKTGNLDKAEAAFHQTLAVSQRMVAVDPDRRDWRLDVLTGHERLGDIAVARGDLGGAMDHYQASLDGRLALSGASADDTQVQRALAIAYLKVGEVNATRGDLVAALSACRSSLGLAQKLAAQMPADADLQRDVSVAQNRVGDVLWEQGDLHGALDSYQAGLAARSAFAVANAGDLTAKADVVVSHNNVGDTRLALGDSSAALTEYQISLTIMLELTKADPANTDWQRTLAVVQSKVGDGKATQGDSRAALLAYRAAMAVSARLSSIDPGNARWQRDLSFAHNRVADTLDGQGDFAGALLEYRTALDIRERLAAARPDNEEWQSDVMFSQNRLGTAMMQSGDKTGALPIFRGSLAIAKRLAEARPGNVERQRNLSINYSRIGDIERDSGDLTAALESYQADLAIAEKLAASDRGNAGWQSDLAVSSDRIGDVLFGRKDPTGAEKAYRRSLDIRERLLTLDPHNATWQRNVVVSHFKLSGSGVETRKHLEAALAITSAMQAAGTLAQQDQWMPGVIRTQLDHLAPASP